MKLKVSNIIKYFYIKDKATIDDFINYFGLKTKEENKKLKKILKDLINKKLIYKENNIYLPYLFAIDKDFKNILKKIAIDPYFSNKALEEALYIKENYINDIEEETISNKRKDLTSLFTVTMDGLNAKDFDDAISLIKEDDNYRLYVHIADVSHYIKIGSQLDKEAYKRGNSYYFAKCVIPMFPFYISNEVCSLNEGVKRLALTIEILLNKNGEILENYFYKSIIKVYKRIPYEIGNEWLKDKRNKYYNFLILCKELKEILYKQRIENNSIDFDLPEVEMEFDKSNIIPSNIYKYIRGETERFIEEFMLVANQSVAKYLQDKAPMIFRVHDSPPEEKREIVYKYLELLGLKKPKKYNQKEINSILNFIRGTNEEKLLSSYILRSMAQAFYSDKNIGHFGLNFENYTHFTSPIRRYSDLVVHRILKSIIDNTKPPYKENDLKKIAEHVSITERNAVEAERDFLKIKGSRFLKTKKDKIFRAFVSGVTENGIFLELEEYGLEGFVPSFIIYKENYVFDKDFLIYFKKNKKDDTIKLGDYFLVSIFSINEKRGFVDLKLIKRI